MIRGLLCGGLIWSVLSAGLAGFTHGAEPLVRLRGVVVDAETGQPLAARLSVQSAAGQWYFPKSAAPEGLAIEYKRQVGPRSVEMHSTLSAHPFQIDLPPGTYRLHVERGKEYVPHDESFDLTAERELRIPLRRWLAMATIGWYSGDTHSHRPLAEMPNLVLAEDLNIAFPLSYWVTSADVGPIRGNRVPVGAVAPTVMEVAPNHLIYPLNTEYEIFTVGGKPHTLGAFVVIGQKTPLDEKTPPVLPIAEKVHAEGALIDLEKHSWPWSIMIAPVMQVDLFELANNHVWQTEFGFPKWTLDAAGEFMNLEKNAEGWTEWGWIDFGFQTYYALLNCGLRLQPTAGTASGVHPVPLGFGRVYVHQPEGFSYENWLAGLRAGRSFVTNGPLLDVRFNDQPPGHSFAAEASWKIDVSGAIYSLSPLDRVEIVTGGEIITVPSLKSEPRQPAGFETRIAHAVQGEGSSWVALRAFESQPAGRVRFAHSAPVHVVVANRPVQPTRAQRDYLIGRVEHELARNQGVLPPEALAEYRKALEFYQRLTGR